MKNSIAIILMVFTSIIQAQIPQSAAIDSIFATWDTIDSPGASLGIIRDGKLIYARGYGQANLEYSIPNTPNSIFRIASTSKQFTAACIVLLSQQNKLSLDATLDTFFPKFPSYAKKITIRHLLHHTSGIRDYLTLASLSGLGNDDFYTDETLMKWLINQEELNFQPGEDHLYSNSGYWLLGQIVNKVSGENMATYAEKNIFKPLGMNNTHFHNDHTRIVKNRASGYRPNEDNGYSISMTTLNMIGDGGIFTSIEDLKKYDDAFYDSEVLNRDFWKEMTTTTTLTNGEEIYYAAGLFLDEHNGLKTIDHGGAFVGYRAEMVRFPEQRFSVIILANRSDANPSGMAYQVADIFLKDLYTEGLDNEDTSSVQTDSKPIIITTDALKKLEGVYWNDVDKISRKLQVKNDTLTYVRTNGRETKMVPISPTKFLWIGPTNPIVLTLDNATSPTGFSLDIPGETISNYKAYTPIEKLTPQQITYYSGDYYSKELDIIYSFKPHEDGLMIYLKGNPMASPTPIKKDIFQLYGGYMTIAFNEDGKGLTLAAGRVKNLKFVKK